MRHGNDAASAAAAHADGQWFITAAGKGPAEPLVPGVTGDTAVSNRRCLITLS